MNNVFSQKIYLNDALQDPSLFTEIVKEEVSTIFSNIEAISSCHESFLEALQSSIKNWTPVTCIGNIVNEMVKKNIKI